ncbi:triosephosphate isomerase [Agaricicola taiwanensis]|uniref:Triosephosphate isomerase n=1 Tax=Agaricicola taiwanensis TaxID=591372 RepID=A0A8J3DVG5_9RHOB|nr:triose-phosphate isomerase [Agaricicola taiwanensis]GGE44576.1 triosephosphate isomerase [Agaricicola taiwanensis]
MTEKAPRPLVAGNWKMNGLSSALEEIGAIADGAASEAAGDAEVAICPPATLLVLAAETVGGAIALGGQDCHPKESGAHTGDISAEMLAELGASYIIVGHSERRSDHGETDALVQEKAKAAWRAGVVPIVCVGETEAERLEGKALEVVGRQLQDSIPGGATADNLVVAYEPVWAIGTGRTPTNEDIAEMHGHMRKLLIERFGANAEGVRLLYGGSVKPANASEILAIADVNGALVGGASLKAKDFLAICEAYA